MKNIAVVGSKGFVGSAICNHIGERYRELHVIPISRKERLENYIEDIDFFVHAANSPSRYKARLDPQFDFEESVVKTSEFIRISHANSIPFLLVSSISARTQMDTDYGRNRKACELLAIASGRAVVARLGYMFSTRRVYGAINDILNNKHVYQASDSEYSFSNLDWNASAIVKLCLNYPQHKQSVVELGAEGRVSLEKVAALLGSSCTFSEDYNDTQIADCDVDDKPSIEEFISYLDSLK